MVSESGYHSPLYYSPVGVRRKKKSKTARGLHPYIELRLILGISKPCRLKPSGKVRECQSVICSAYSIAVNGSYVPVGRFLRVKAGKSTQKKF